MRDLRPIIRAQGWSLRQVWRQVGGVEAHFHRVISGKSHTSIRLAKRIEAATGGLIRWTDFFEDQPSEPLSPPSAAA